MARNEFKIDTDQQLVNSVYETICTHGMLQTRDAVLVGVSGGPDSMALLHILCRISKYISISLGVAHLNHSMRGSASDDDEKFVQSEANNLNLKFFSKKLPPDFWKKKKIASTEEKARIERYEFFSKIAKTHGFNKLALGHHAGDNAELVLMRLLRGSGTPGISGIQAVREEAHGKYSIIRPLIRCSRKEIMEFLSQNKVKSVCDSSNKDLRFLRNRIRHQLIPFLESGFNSNIEEILNRHAAVVGAENEWMNALVKPLFKAAVRTKKRSRLVLDLQIILSYPPAARRRVIREAILEVKGDLRRIGFNHIEAVMKIEGANDGLKVLHLPNRVRVEKEYENLSFEKISERKKSGRPCLEKTSTSFRYIVKRYGTTNIIELGKQLSIELHRSLLFSGEMKIGNNIAFFDGDKIDFPLLIRNIEPGDRFRPVGLFGTQKLKKYFIDHKVPKRDREVTPVIVCRDRIIWVAGHRIDESVKVDETTRRIVRMELSLDFEKENG